MYISSDWDISSSLCLGNYFFMYMYLYVHVCACMCMYISDDSVNHFDTEVSVFYPHSIMVECTALINSLSFNDI